MGPYIYSAQFATPTVIHAYQVDSQTGNLTEIPGSPFSAGASANCCGGLAISGNPTQAVSGPAVSIFPSSATFSSVVGVTSSTQVFSIVNTGGQLLAISSISIIGANASSFSQANTCLATLAPNANCSVSINFTPATAGALTATLQVADNAPGSPQTLVLNGTGIAPAPAITFSPSTLSFPSINQGTSSSPQPLTVISSGNTPLHFSSVSLSGPNPSDFSFANNCTAPLAPASNCIISLVFTPSAAGQRVANLMSRQAAPRFCHRQLPCDCRQFRQYPCPRRSRSHLLCFYCCSPSLCVRETTVRSATPRAVTAWPFAEFSPPQSSASR